MGDNQLFYILLALFQKNSLLPVQKYANKSLEMLLRLNGEENSNCLLSVISYY